MPWSAWLPRRREFRGSVNSDCNGLQEAFDISYHVKELGGCIGDFPTENERFPLDFFRSIASEGLRKAYGIGFDLRVTLGKGFRDSIS